VRADEEVNGRDRRLAVDGIHRQPSLGFDGGRGEARIVERKRQGHREAARMRGGDELLGIRSLAVAEARLERVWNILERAALHRKRSASFLGGALPAGRCLALHDGIPPIAESAF